MAAHPQPRLTPEQYLEIDRAAEIRSEFYDGQMYAMSGAAFAHVFITTNFACELGLALKGRPCLVGSNKLRVRVAPDGLYAYPDVVVVSGEPKAPDGHNDTLLNPALIAEVLSPSTESEDRGFKFSQYRMIESLKEYVLVSQWEYRVEVFHRQENGEWLLSEAAGPEGVCNLRALNCTVALSRIYRGVTISPRPGKPTTPPPETTR